MSSRTSKLNPVCKGDRVQLAYTTLSDTLEWMNGKYPSLPQHLIVDVHLINLDRPVVLSANQVVA